MACDFIQNLAIRDCFRNGKAPANEFIFETLKLYHSERADEDIHRNIESYSNKLYSIIL